MKERESVCGGDAFESKRMMELTDATSSYVQWNAVSYMHIFPPCRDTVRCFLVSVISDELKTWTSIYLSTANRIAQDIASDDVGRRDGLADAKIKARTYQNVYWYHVCMNV